MQQSMTSKPSIMWVLNALGRSWAQAEPHLHSWGVAVDGTDPHGESKGLVLITGSKVRHCAGAAERTFLLESNRFKLQWIANSLWLT